MRFENVIFEKDSATFQKMKRFSGALLLLVLSGLGAAAQIMPTSSPTPVPMVAPTVNPTITPNATTSTNPIDNAKPLTIAETVDLALKQASAFRAAQIGEQIAAQDVRLAKAALYPRVADGKHNKRHDAPAVVFRRERDYRISSRNQRCGRDRYVGKITGNNKKKQVFSRSGSRRNGSRQTRFGGRRNRRLLQSRACHFKATRR